MVHKNGIIITIDGFVATGKGTIAKSVAHLLNYRYLDTGSMYRAVALYAIRHGLLDAPEHEKETMLSQIVLEFYPHKESGLQHIYLNGEDVELQIRDPHLSSQMKPIVTSPAVRTWLGDEQRRIGQTGRIIVDGRDMGTVVFPDAELKLFLTGDKEVRAQRRYDEMMQKGIQTTLDAIIHDIEVRDTTDYLGIDAVNWKADDAIEIDTSVLTIDEQTTIVYKLALEKINV